MPLARWAKAVMTLQAAGSLAVLGLVIARAQTRRGDRRSYGRMLTARAAQRDIRQMTP